MAAALITALVLATLPPQQLASGACALALWSREDKPRLVGMAFAAPRALRLDVGGGPRDLALAGSEGGTVGGFAPRARYAAEGFAVSLDLDLEPRDGMDGAVARQGAIRLEPAAGEAVVLPVAAIAACAPAVRR